MRFDKKLVNPHDNMVFECAFDNLMEQIGRQELMDVSSRKAMRERLLVTDSEYEH